jgi:hypothetical protein
LIFFFSYLFYERENRPAKLVAIAARAAKKKATAAAAALASANVPTATDTSNAVDTSNEDDSSNNSVHDQGAEKEVAKEPGRLVQEKEEEGEEEQEGQEEEEGEEEILKRRRNFKDLVPFVQCKVPSQRNGYDCGVFVIKYIEMIISKLPICFPKDMRSKFSDQLPTTAFTPQDVTEERHALRIILSDLQPEYAVFRSELAEREKDKVDDDSIEMIEQSTAKMASDTKKRNKNNNSK